MTKQNKTEKRKKRKIRFTKSSDFQYGIVDYNTSEEGDLIAETQFNTEKRLNLTVSLSNKYVNEFIQENPDFSGNKRLLELEQLNVDTSYDEYFVYEDDLREYCESNQITLEVGETA